jgi:hypothetical protein
MGAHDGAVDHRVFIVGVGRKMLEDTLPHAGGGPTAMTCVHILPGTEPVKATSG